MDASDHQPPTMRSLIRPSTGSLSLLRRPPGPTFSLVVSVSQRVASTAQHHAAHRPFVRHLSATTAPRSSMTSGSTRDDNSSNAQQPKFTAHSDPEALETFLSPLLVTNGGRWTLAMEGQALEREFKFKTFAKTWVSLLHPPCLVLFLGG